MSLFTKLGNSISWLRKNLRNSIVKKQEAKSEAAAVAHGTPLDINQLMPRNRQRDLTGLEIAAVRTANLGNFPTGRMGRSKYLPTGVPCAVTKLARLQLKAA